MLAGIVVWVFAEERGEVTGLEGNERIREMKKGTDIDKI